MAEKPEDMKNLGPVSVAWLREAGIATPTALRQSDAIAACLAVRALGHRPSVNLLYAIDGAIDGAIEGAIVDQHWTRVDRGRLLPGLDQAEQVHGILD